MTAFIKFFPLALLSSLTVVFSFAQYMAGLVHLCSFEVAILIILPEGAFRHTFLISTYNFRNTGIVILTLYFKLVVFFFLLYHQLPVPVLLLFHHPAVHRIFFKYS